MNRALVFSGQGSQYVGMIKDLYDNFDNVKNQIVIANETVGYDLGDIAFNGPDTKLKETRYTQPAIFLHSAVLFDLLKDKLEFGAVAGHSVGEYSALYAAGVLTFEDAIRLVATRGELMFTLGGQIPGTMFAVIGLDDEKVEAVCQEINNPAEKKFIVAANYNCPGQLVISGTADYLRENVAAFKDAGARMVKELVVSGAFHSPLMQPAQDKLEEAINNTKFMDAKVPVYSNVSGEPLIKAEEIKKSLIAQLTSPVKWTQSLVNMNNDGFDDYFELGPGNVLQGLIKRTLSDVKISGVDKLQDINNYLS